MTVPSFKRRLILQLALRQRCSEGGQSSDLSKCEPSNQGVTLVECLVAIAAIALTTAMITPPLFLAAATRLQNQRAEQALQIAQGEIDRVRYLVERQQHTSARLPATVPTDPSFSTTAAPAQLTTLMKSNNSACANPYQDQQVPVTQALRVDIDGIRDGSGNCTPEFMMQTFRTEGETSDGEDLKPPASQRPSTFCLVVRVYASPAIDNLRQGGALSTEAASLQFTSGEGNQRTRPLAVLTTPVVWSDRDFSSREIRNGTTSICPAR